MEEDFFKQLIRKSSKSIVPTSANNSGEAPPENLEVITDEIKNRVDYVVSIGQKENKKVELSSVFKLRLAGEVKVVRR